MPDCNDVYYYNDNDIEDSIYIEDSALTMQKNVNEPNGSIKTISEDVDGLNKSINKIKEENEKLKEIVGYLIYKNESQSLMNELLEIKNNRVAYENDKLRAFLISSRISTFLFQKKKQQEISDIKTESINEFNDEIQNIIKEIQNLNPHEYIDKVKEEIFNDFEQT